MSKIRCKVEIHIALDTDDYPIPADGLLSMQLKEDIQDAVESSISVEVQAIKVTGISAKNDKLQDHLRD